MAERYGDAVRYQPDLNASTFLLWAAPWIAVAVGAQSAPPQKDGPEPITPFALMFSFRSIP